MDQDKVKALFPDLKRIEDPELRNKVILAWIESLEQGGWRIEDLNRMPFTLLIEGVTINLIEHTNNVTRTALAIAAELQNAYPDLNINMDLLVAGALLHDVAKPVEYDLQGDTFVKSRIGEYLRHPIGGAALAGKIGLPNEIIHSIGSHSKEGNHARRTVETIIIHHADFLNFEPFLK